MDIVILGGFLGGGKTTTLNNLIKQAIKHELKPAIIMNDFGKASVDRFLVDQTVPMDEIIEGCICCAMKGDVSRQLHQLYLDYQPDVVFVECSGIAEPQSVIDACLTPALTPISTIQAVIGVIDASLYAKLETYPGEMQKLYYEQLAHCSHLFINKIDCCETEAVAKIYSDLNILNPEAEITIGSYGHIESDLFKQKEMKKREAIEDNVSSCNTSQHRHHDGIGHRYFEFDSAIALEQLVGWLEKLPQSIYRVKGFIRFKEHPETQLVQYSAGQVEISPISIESKVQNYLVVIGSHLEKLKSPII
ncbi:GTP-binding protein [Staphylococcus condimenti]|uniref:GTP-binding protein n=1 Tax=Staphylococcus condimenti TaxID=70255 RepID=A0A143PF14_9STAP|nr:MULTISPECIES: GTP-binding protein [Staphylococcus]AMY06354.1 GTPase [Staphylococcus condimenti]APR60237.1 GTPase [Staphylococcus condimenti]MDK8644304.1 GTP-binding protein [Staphylococcus condimenti]OFP00197.1 GTPase [Staphylococcus sp. HMSC065E08]PNZ59692.1 GTP-binding protein [Staphylococcus condimenti]